MEGSEHPPSESEQREVGVEGTCGVVAKQDRGALVPAKAACQLLQSLGHVHGVDHDRVAIRPPRYPAVADHGPTAVDANTGPHPAAAREFHSLSPWADYREASPGCGPFTS